MRANTASVSALILGTEVLYAPLKAATSLSVHKVCTIACCIYLLISSTLPVLRLTKHYREKSYLIV